MCDRNQVISRPAGHDDEEDAELEAEPEAEGDNVHQTVRRILDDVQDNIEGFNTMLIGAVVEPDEEDPTKAKLAAYNWISEKQQEAIFFRSMFAQWALRQVKQAAAYKTLTATEKKALTVETITDRKFGLASAFRCICLRDRLQAVGGRL